MQTYTSRKDKEGSLRPLNFKGKTSNVARYAEEEKEKDRHLPLLCQLFIGLLEAFWMTKEARLHKKAMRSQSLA